MAKTIALRENRATPTHGSLCVENAASVQLSSALADVAKRLFDKPYRALVDALNISERDAHYRLAGKRKFTAVEIARLLQSEDGIQFLVVLMEGNRPAWWQAVLKMRVLGGVEARRRADRELLEKVFHADAETADAFSAAFRAQDPDFYGVALEGHDRTSGTRDRHRALAPKAKR